MLAEWLKTSEPVGKQRRKKTKKTMRDHCEAGSTHRDSEHRDEDGLQVGAGNPETHGTASIWMSERLGGLDPRGEARYCPCPAMWVRSLLRCSAVMHDAGLVL